ncbi:hypothetical protein C2E21_6131 [Chlorella sorokiniana]|uniref:Uncharacterized protein n=1 Tax=Chlorella sorokiniana TaxID=3076 RepID=A0A2P6TKY4_CHLSO|nr:hypothetical protein C2E21_6131 [Chlorella sorokiniana]|eukprot:PRW44957.1 hypothetical protein C2E21_6131 [Chlorella sorokiniana]
MSLSPQPAPRLSASPSSAAGCHHCLACCAGLTFGEAAMSRSRGASAEWCEWWPAGLQSPTVYFYLRTKQLRYLLCHGGSESRELWRPFRDCDYRCCAMLRRRGRAPLAIHVPAAQTGIDQNEDNEPQFVRTVSVPLCPAATPAAACALPPSPFSAPAAAALPSATALTAAKLASAAALAASASAASLAPTTAAQQQLTGSGGGGSRPLQRSWRALAAELQALASPAHSSSSSLALSGSGESSSCSLSQGSPSPASVLRSQGAARPPRPRLTSALARLDCASARWQQAKVQLLAAQPPPPQQQQQQQQQLCSGGQVGSAPPSAGAPGSCREPPEAWATASVPPVPMLPV